MISIDGWAAGFAFSCSALLTGLTRRYALRRNLIDTPNARSSHTRPTPRGGGLAIVATLTAALFALAACRLLDVRSAAALVIGGGIVSWVGFLDDRRSLRASLRFAAHVAAACIVVFSLRGTAELVASSLGIRSAWAGALLAIFALTGTTNLFNFMDGIDGIAGIEAAFVAGSGAWLSTLRGGEPGFVVAMICLAAASIGFLVWNWPPAKIFLGDVGSGFLGFMLTALGLAVGRGAPIPVQVWIILGGVFFVDAIITLMRRVARGDRWFEAHRTHAYQILAARWNSHFAVTLLVGVINLGWLLPWAWYAVKAPANANAIMVAALSPLLALVLVVGAGRRQI